MRDDLLLFFQDQQAHILDAGPDVLAEEVKDYYDAAGCGNETLTLLKRAGFHFFSIKDAAKETKSVKRQRDQFLQENVRWMHCNLQAFPILKT